VESFKKETGEMNIGKWTSFLSVFTGLMGALNIKATNRPEPK